MKTIEYYLKSPKNLIKEEKELQPLVAGQALLKPVITGICGSDVHYYLGHKDPKKLQERLPVILLHEGVAEVIDFKGQAPFKQGDKVVVIPFLACGRCSACLSGLENLCPKSKYMGATGNGLARELLVYPVNKLVKLPPTLDEEVAALTEPLSITYRCFKDLKLKPSNKILIMGEGPMGYLLAVVLSQFGKIIKDKLYLSGMFEEKLKLAESFCQTFNIIKPSEADNLDKLQGQFDYVFECVGGQAMKATVNQALNLLKPGGQLITLGISDEQVPLNINKVVNNGLTIKGSSRSLDQDYLEALNLMQDKDTQSLLKRLVNPNRIKIKNLEDLQMAFELASDKSQIGRIMLYW